MYFGVHCVQVRMSTTASCSVPIYGARTVVHSSVELDLEFFLFTEFLQLYSECAGSHWTEKDFLCFYAIESGVLVSHEVWQKKEYSTTW